MPLDPNIPLAVKPLSVDPIGAYGRVVQLKTLGQRSKLYDQQMQENDLQLQAQKRAAADVEAFSAALKKHTTTGPDGTVATDHKAVMADLARSGAGTALLKYRDDVAKLNQQEWATRKAQIEGRAAAAGAIASEFNGVTTPEQWEAAKTRIKERFAPAMPELAEQMDGLGAYSEDAQKRIVASGMTAQQWLGHVLALGQDARAAETHTTELPGKQADAAGKVRAEAAGQLGAATTREDYARIWNALPAGVARSFPPPESFDPKTTPETVRTAGMTPAQQDTSARLQAQLKLERQKFDRMPGAADEQYQRAWQRYTGYLTEHDREQRAVVDRSPTKSTMDPNDPFTTTRTSQAPAYAPPQSFNQWAATQAPELKLGDQPTTPATPTAPAAPASAPAAPAAPAAAAKRMPTIGEVVTVKGKRWKVTKVYPDGTFDGEPVTP
jgi:hypothetical protein